MGLLDDVIAADSAVFTDLDGFGEVVTYNPVGGTPRQINATVFRDPPSDVPQTQGSGQTGTINIFVRNHATLGASSIDKGGDTFEFAPRIGGESAKFSIAGFISQDAGGWMLRLRGPSK